MSDGRILSILNSAAVQSVQGTSTSSGNASAPPGNLSQLLPGGVLRGEVIGRDSGGNPILRTAQGSDITIRTETFLKYGNQVVIKVDQTGQGAKILSIDGQSPQNANPTIPFDPDSVVDEVLTNQTSNRSNNSSITPSLSNLLSSEAEDVPESILIRSILLSKAPSAATVLSNLPSQVRIPAETLQPGTQVFLRIAGNQTQTQLPSPNVTLTTPTNASIVSSLPQDVSASPLQKLLTPSSPILNIPTSNTPASPSVPNSVAVGNANVPASTTQLQPSALQTTPPAITPPNALSSTNSAPTSAAASANTPQNLPQQPQVQSPNLDQRSVPRANIQPQISPAPSTTPANASNIQATFMAFDANGDATFQSSLGIIKMPQGVLGNIRMTPGTPLLFDVTGFRSVSTATNSTSALASSSYSSITGMTGTLSDIFTIIQSVNPQAATELANRMPQTGANFTGSTLFFIAAMTGGDVGKLLGQKATSILEQQGRGDLIRKLGSDFAVSRTGFGETTQTNWQLFYIPLLHEQEIHPVRMFVKKDKEKDAKDKKKKSDTRFVIEVNLSVLGEIQLDGFVKHKEKGLQFDLMLRTLQPLMPEDEKAIFEIYNNAAQIAGFTGSLNIQTLKDFPVKPMEEMLKSKEGSITA